VLIRKREMLNPIFGRSIFEIPSRFNILLLTCGTLLPLSISVWNFIGHASCLRSSPLILSPLIWGFHSSHPHPHLRLCHLELGSLILALIAAYEGGHKPFPTLPICNLQSSVPVLHSPFSTLPAPDIYIGKYFKYPLLPAWELSSSWPIRDFRCRYRVSMVFMTRRWSGGISDRRLQNYRRSHRTVLVIVSESADS